MNPVMKKRRTVNLRMGIMMTKITDLKKVMPIMRILMTMLEQNFIIFSMKRRIAKRTRMMNIMAMVPLNIWLKDGMQGSRTSESH